MKDEEFQKLLDAPGPLVLRKEPSFLSTDSALIFWAIGTIVLFFFMHYTYVAIASCIFFVFLFAEKLFFSRVWRGGTLIINLEGFSIVTQRNVDAFKWNRVSNIQVTDEAIIYDLWPNEKLEISDILDNIKHIIDKDKSNANKMEKVTFIDHESPLQQGATFNKWLHNYENLAPKQLTQLLNHWRERALAAK